MFFTTSLRKVVAELSAHIVPGGTPPHEDDSADLIYVLEWARESVHNSIFHEFRKENLLSEVLVTGGSGFIGARLVGELLGAGHRVRVFDKQTCASHADITMVGDIRDHSALDAAVSGADLVYHLAAEHRDDVRPAQLYYDVNVDGARNLVTAMRRHNVRRLVFTSTVAFYGLDQPNPGESARISPFNDYGKSKYEAECVLRSWAQETGSDLILVRPAAIFGEGNRGNIHNLLSHVAKGKFVFVGNGENRKSMGYVENLVQFLLFAPEAKKGVWVTNYADKPDMTTRQMVMVTRNALGLAETSLLSVPYVVGLFGGFAFDLIAWLRGKPFSISSVRVRKFCAETTIATDELEASGFKAPFSLEDGLRKMIAAEFSSSTMSGHR